MVREILRLTSHIWITLKSTIPSYPTARPSRDLIGAEQADEEHLPGYFIFENEWQSFHTKKDRVLNLKTPFHERNPRWYKIAAKVMDISGNDAMKLIEVSV